MAARKGSTIGANPLDQVAPLRAPLRAPVPVAAEEPAKLPRERVTIALPGELMERARNAVWWTPGATLAGLVEEAVAAELDRLEKERGAPFEPRTSTKLKAGRWMRA